MTGQIMLREMVRQSAEMAFKAGKTIDDCPDEMLPYLEEWAIEFRLAEFESTSEDEPCQQ